MKLFCYFIMAGSLVYLPACGHDFLDAKQDANQVVPISIEDHQALLDNNSIMNVTSFSLGTLGADEHWSTDEILNSFMVNNRWQVNGYMWAQEVFEEAEVSDWNMAYQRILYANTALGIAKFTAHSNRQSLAREEVIGQALFHRAWNFYQLAQTFCKPYDQSTAHDDLGLPLRLDPDVSLIVKRSSVKSTYDRILEDLRRAEQLLTDKSMHLFRPSRAAANALLARVSLHMEDYRAALAYANKALSLSNGLVDFNNLDTASRQLFADKPYGKGNPEVIYTAQDNSVSLIADHRLNVDSVLYNLYEPNDLRRAGYYLKTHDGRITFKGSYRGDDTYFSGFATNELYLIRAECLVRIGELDAAAEVLNDLLLHRYIKDTFVPLIFQDQSSALATIISEKRKELFLRGTRWDDLRRLNKHPETATTLYRKVNAEHHQLPPNDPRWVWPIPNNEIILNGIKQNSR